MPKVIGHTPPWLSKPSPGAEIFSINPDTSQQSPASPSRRAAVQQVSSDYYGPRRLIAHRGNEIFVAVGKEIRWADLSKVKQDWETSSRSPSRRQDGVNAQQPQQPKSYRVLHASVSDEVRQLVISPSGHFLAICDERTIRIAILPDTAKLAQDTKPFKLKTFHLGPTTHVKPESPLASVLWHPLAASTSGSDCLITVTTSAAVRVWEIDRSNQWSFERPALAIDLRKLADGVSCEEDFQPSSFGKNRGFSVDDIDMEVASACFGGQGADGEDAWASMTLWSSMKNGDVYALCPLLPSRWCPTETTIPSLTTSTVASLAVIAGEDVDPEERHAAEQQYEWVREIDDEEPVDDTEAADEVEVRYRPDNPSAIPRLQGPFSLDLGDDEDDADVEITDILVFPPQLDETDLYSGEDDFDSDASVSTTLPFNTLFLATSASEVYVALEVQGVSGQWLPKKGRSTFALPTTEASELAVVQKHNLQEKQSDQPSFLAFSPSSSQRYSTFLTTSNQVYSMSLDDWASRVSEDISGAIAVDSGLKTRLETSCKSQVSILERILSTKDGEHLSSPIVLQDPSTGYSVLSMSSSQAYGATLDQPSLHTPQQSPVDSSKSQSNGLQLVRFDTDQSAQEPTETREIFSPPRILDYHPNQPINSLVQKLPIRQKSILKEQPMRLSPAMLDLMTSTHRTISKQTAELENAAAELFRRCTRLMEELGDQVKQMAELADRLQRLRNGDEDGSSAQKEVKKTPDDRLEAAKERQAAMTKRYEVLRKKAGQVGMAKKDLSAKETTWMAEIEALNNNIGHDIEANNATSGEGTLTERFEAVSAHLAHRKITTKIFQVKKLASDLLAQSQHLQKQHEDDVSKSTSTIGGKPGLERSDSTASRRSGVEGRACVSARYQREKIAEVMGSVEREGAIIDAVLGRLANLQV